MGYRNYIGVMPKREYNKIKSMTKDQLIDFYQLEIDEDEKEDGYIPKGVYEFGKELYELGKYVEYYKLKHYMKTFFKKKELNKHYNYEQELWVVTKEFLEYIIEDYKSNVKAHYKKMIDPFLDASTVDDCFPKKGDFLKSVKIEYNFPDDNYTYDFSKITPEQQTALHSMIQHIMANQTEWTLLQTYNLHKGDDITTSWKYEYAIFELVRIYKSFDWKRNVLLYYGY